MAENSTPASEPPSEGSGDTFRTRSRILAWWQDGSSFLLVRAASLRLLGLVYFVAFVSTIRQGPALIDDQGLLPARWWLDDVARVSCAGLAS